MTTDNIDFNNFDDIKRVHSGGYFDVFARYDICFTHGKGSTLYDTEGRAYTDFLAGIAVNCLGYGDIDLVDTIHQQANMLMHTSNLFYNRPQAELTSLLLSCGTFDKVFMCNSGAEANEAAIKLVRKHYNAKGGARYKFVTAVNSFHGRTLATATATGQPKYSSQFSPLPDGFIHLPFNDCAALDNCLENDDAIAAVMLETIQGEGGVIQATPQYLNLARSLTLKHGVALIIDEVQTGVMRCGSLFSFEKYGIAPDIATLAKGLGGGMPIGAMLARGEVAGAFAKGDHGTTFGGNPLACAAACTVLKKLSADGFKEQVEAKGLLLRKLLSSLCALPMVKGVSGSGLMCGLALKDSTDGRQVVADMLKKGFIINCAGNNTLRFVPPLIITALEIESITDTLADVLSSY